MQREEPAAQNLAPGKICRLREILHSARNLALARNFAQ